MKKKSQVIILPTKDKSNIIKANTSNLLWYDNRPANHKYHTYQHIYITTDDEIKEGDKYISDNHNQILECSDTLSNTRHVYSGCFKIISSTDEKLGLPRPSQVFIEKYCKVGGIDKVLVEYEEYYIDEKTGNKIHYFGFEFDDAVSDGLVIPKKVIKLKVDSHNTVTIHSIKKS